MLGISKGGTCATDVSYHLYRDGKQPRSKTVDTPTGRGPLKPPENRGGGARNMPPHPRQKVPTVEEVKLQNRFQGLTVEEATLPTTTEEPTSPPPKGKKKQKKQKQPSLTLRAEADPNRSITHTGTLEGETERISTIQDGKLAIVEPVTSFQETTSGGSGSQTLQTLPRTETRDTTVSDGTTGRVVPGD